MTTEKKADEKKGIENPNKILYIGDDLSYWNNIKKQFKSDYKTFIIDYHNIFKKEPKDVQALIPFILEQRFKAVYIDFANNMKEHMHLVRVLSRLNNIIKPIIMGLLDYNASAADIKLIALTGCHVFHIKGAEYENVVHSCMAMAFPDTAEDHGFVKAALNDPVTSYIPCKAGVISPYGMRLESHFFLNPKTQVDVHTHWNELGLLKTPLVTVSSTTEEDLYYNFGFAQEVAFEFAPPIEIYDDTPEHIVEEKNLERNAIVDVCVDEMFKWFEKNQSISKQKRLKVMVIDKELNMYRNTAQSDLYSFTLRCQPYIRNMKYELTNVAPQIIFFALEEVPQEELEANEDIAYSFNTKTMLQHMVKTIKEIDNYAPYLVIFNAHDIDTEKLRHTLNYKSIMAFNSALNPLAVVKMSERLDTEKQVPTVPKEDEIPIIYVDKDSPVSYCELEMPITMLSCSEMDVYFKCNIDLKVGTLIKTKSPTDMYITVANQPKSSQFPQDFYGVIHGIGEARKSQLRKFINSVFFRELEGQKKAEKEEVAKIKAAAIQKKLDDAAEAKRLADEKAKADALAKKQAQEESKRKQEEALKAKKSDKDSSDEEE